MSDQTAGFRCAVGARERADPQIGSAPQAQGWLLLEHPGPWQLDAIAGTGIEPGVLGQLTSSARQYGVRILLVRRPGRSAGADRRHWTLIRDARSVTGPWGSDADLLAAVPLLAGGSRLGPRWADPVVLVCTHGVHDACCAIRGRPVAAALAERWPAAVWECSHVGGDRFAANVVLLPDGYYYGQLDPTSAVSTVEAHLAGRVQADHLRGPAAHPPAVQTAVVAAHARFGPMPAAAISVESVHRDGPEGGHGSETEVVLRVGARTGRAQVLAVRREPAQLTCRAGRPTPATAYELTWLDGPSR